MLAELFQIARNLHAQGIPAGLIHRDFDVPGISGYTTIRIVLDEAGEVVHMVPLTTQDAAGLWTLKRYNFKFFPAVRPAGPLLVMSPTDARWDSVIKDPTPDGVAQLADETDAQGPKAGLDLSAERDDQASRIQRWESDTSSEVLMVIKAFAAAFQTFASVPVASRIRLTTAIRNAARLATDKQTLRALTTVLVGELRTPRNKPAEVAYKVQLCFDFRPTHDVTFSLYGAKARVVKRVVLESLANEDAGGLPQRVGRCALTGQDQPLLTERMAGWRAPPIIPRALPPFSKFSEAKCNYRYHRADSDAFPVASATADALVSALKTITDRMEGQAWRGIRTGRIEEKQGRKIEAQDILIAYPSWPLEDLSLVDIFARANTGDIDPQRAMKDFAETAEPICKALLKETSQESFVAWLEILLIRQISPGQIQLAYSASPSLGTFIAAVGHWAAAGHNLPPRLKVPLRSGKATAALGWFHPSVLFPEDVGRLLSHHWIRDGTETTRVQAPPVGMVLDVFLRKTGVWRDAARELLETALSRSEELLTRAGHVLHRDDGSHRLWRDFVANAASARERRDPDLALAQTLSLIGSMLYAMNSNVQDYMNESAYLVGRLLAMMDELHKCYCITVRDGDIPNALIGNGLLGRAADSPAQALDELLDRSRVYLGWAKSAPDQPGGRDAVRIAVRSARKVLRLAQPLAERLHTEPKLDTALDSVQKAHLFLGYLSPILGSDDPARQPEGGEDDTEPDPAEGTNRNEVNS